MDTWEYFTTTISTDDPNLEVPIQDNIPRKASYPTYSTYKLIPQLNYFGSQGWELISIEPVQQGRNGDLRIPDTAGGQWTYTFFVAFKRRIHLTDDVTIASRVG